MTGKRGAVVLFVKGLPVSITPNALRLKFRQLLETRRWLGFSLGGAIGSCDIVRIVNPESDEVEFHGLVEVQPAKLALQAITLLNGSKIEEHTVEVRRYHHRASFRDRRQEIIRGGDTNPINRRAIERRRDGLRIELVEWRGSRLFPSLVRAFQPNGPIKGIGI